MPNDENLGYGAGNNVGIKFAKYSLVVIANPDARFVDNPLRRVRAQMWDKGFWAIGGKQISRMGVSFFLRPEFQYPVIREVSSRILSKLGLYSDRIMALSGALLFLDKRKFEELGTFDENIFPLWRRS